MKKIILFILFLIPFGVKADTIYNVDMDIYINKDGTANITEIWNVKAETGSEWYKKLYNLRNSEVNNYKVYMDNKLLTYKDWNVNEDIKNKSGYYGINYVSEGLELCFGKSDYKKHTFKLTYDMSNYVFNVSDAQVLYWTLFPNVTLNNFSVKVRSYYDFSDTLDVWGTGYKGYAYVKDGIIEMSNEGSLNNDYVVLLVKFPVNTFTTSNSYSNYTDFNSILNKSEEGTYEYDYDVDDGVENNIEEGTYEYYIDEIEDSVFHKIMKIIFGIIPFLSYALITLIVVNVTKKNRYGYKDNKIIDKKDILPYRDIPCNKDIYYANSLVKLNNNIFNDYKETNIFGAILLKWIREDKVKIINEKKGIFNKETSSIDLTKNSLFDTDLEKELFDIMYKASGDGILETKELEKWCKNNYRKFFNLFDKISNTEIEKLKDNNYIYTRKSKEECKYKNVMDDSLYEESVKLYGLKKFLDEFSNMKEKEAIEVKLWDEYMMFAYLFGIADEVAKQFKNLYPEVVEQLDYDYDTFIFINHISTSGYRSASSARSAARAAAESYSAGGGGFSSGGGGGGSFGGGGSMGGR